MMRPEELIPGNFYFFISYSHEDLEVPNIQTLIFKEMLRERKGEDRWIFRYATGSEPADEIEEIGMDENLLLNVLDLKGLQNALLEMEDFYPVIPVSIIIGDIDRTNFSDLEKTVGEFLASEKSDSLSITIRYTGKGLSLIKRNDRVEALLFIHWKIDPAREKKTRSFFQNRNLNPHQDYLAERGRLRILNYTLPAEKKSIMNIAVDVFKEIYGMKSTEEFRFHLSTSPKKPKKRTRS
jgi:hypothetical protein